MSDIVSHLESNGIDFSKLKALEFFARKGDWHTQSYCNKVASINAWEIDKVFEEELKKNLSMATVAIGDSFTLAKEDKYANLFDFIVMLENILRAWLLWKVWMWMRSVSVQGKRPVLVVLLSYLLLEMVWSLGTVNWGNAVRHHIPSVGLLLIVGFAYAGASFKKGRFH